MKKLGRYDWLCLLAVTSPYLVVASLQGDVTRLRPICFELDLGMYAEAFRPLLGIVWWKVAVLLLPRVNA